jgi:hypothetical protein
MAKRPASIECADIDLHPDVNSFGTFANAIRVIPEAGSECFIDFLVYSAQENKAQVVARLRVHVSFLPVILSRMRNEVRSIEGLTEEMDLTMKDGVVRTTAGHLVFFNPPKGES